MKSIIRDWAITADQVLEEDFEESYPPSLIYLGLTRIYHKDGNE